MRIPSASRLSVLVACLLLASARDAAATKCLQFEPAIEKAHHALVFLGTVEAVLDSTTHSSTAGERRRIARVRMNSIWKGIPRRELLNVTEIVDPVGAPRLAPGETYVFYVDSSVIGWRFDACSRTRRLSDASEDLAALGKPAIVQRLPGRKLRSPH